MRKFNRPYIRNRDVQFTPIYIQGENYSFYFNKTLYDTDISSILLRIINVDGTLVSGLYTLDNIFVSGSIGYNLYKQNLVFPFIPNGQYYFQLYNYARNREVGRSNLILVNGSYIYNSTLVKFRHNDQLYGVRYDLLPDFWQIFRLPICQIGSSEIRSEREQYREASNGRELRNTKSFRDVVFHLEMYWADDIDFQAVSAILEHTDIYISGYKMINMSQIKVEKPSELSKLSKGTFDVIVDDYNIDTSTPEYYGEFIIFGGNGYVNFNTFVVAN